MRVGAFLLIGGLLSVSMPARSADLMGKGASLAPLPANFDWTGFYVGLSGGYLDPNYSVKSPIGGRRDFGDGGFLIGGTIGYNRQFGRFVAGVEGDMSYAHADGDYDDLFGFGSGFGGKADINYLATVRGRIGVALDRVLLYGTGGLALSDVDFKTELGSIHDNTRAGYTVGGGVEYAFTQNITAKVEYLYSDFRAKDKDFDAASIDTDFDLRTVRVGLNYKF